MSQLVIEIQGLSKKFTLGHENQRYQTLREIITDGVKSVINPRKRAPAAEEEFWALYDVSFSIEQGERVGIIGRNGAGKSTLLKILSQITEPTRGSVRIRGRVASLLEVGTGFHPELTGRENIFLNGAILGMSSSEVRRKFDEIVAFAEIEKFLDTPVKRYSSGMYVRLAFAVAAHLEPEILVVDEVLAVGDAEFQKKCLGKMQEVSGEGRTVVFVSHNMGIMLQLCSKGILLHNGNLLASGQMDLVVDQYIGLSKSIENRIEQSLDLAEIHFRKVFMTDALGASRSDYRFDEDIIIRAEMYIPKFAPALELAMRLIDRYKRGVFTVHQKLEPYYEKDPTIRLNVIIPKRFLTPGQYSWIICINNPGLSLYDLKNDVMSFTILETGSGFARYEGADYGCVFVEHQIQIVNNKS